MRLALVFLLLFTPVLSFSGTIWNYNLTGKVSGPIDAVDYLRDISVGDDIAVKMRVEYSENEHKVRFSGNIGTWLFSQQETMGFYAIGDSAPERFYTPGSSSALEPPVGNYGEIIAVDLFLIFFGFDETGSSQIPEAQRLVKSDGRIDPSWFRSGGLTFNFWAISDPGTGETLETDLYGTIDTMTAVPEPSSVFLFGSAMLSMAAFRMRRRSICPCKGRHSTARVCTSE